MKHLFLLITLFTFLPFSASASGVLNLTLDGKDYSCKESGAASKCACKAEGAVTTFYVNGVEAKIWNGSGGKQMMECTTFLSNKSFCADSVVDCGCVANGSAISFRVNQVEVRYWNGVGGREMMSCEEFLQEQNFCR